VPFEVFDKKAIPRSGELQVTIQKTGVIAFNQVAFLALGEPEAVELLYDREEQVVGIRKVDRKIRHAYLVRHNHRGTTHMVAGQAFTKHYGISTVEGRRWTAVLQGDVLCINLKEDGVQVAVHSAAIHD
jgi:hypothetical protein